MYLDLDAMQDPAQSTPRATGCLAEDAQGHIEHARQTIPSKPVRAVMHWRWCDVFDLGAIDTLREHPSFTFLQAGKVVFDDSDNSFLGSDVMTTNFVALHASVIFETRNTHYVLIGQGERLVFRDPDLLPRPRTH